MREDVEAWLRRREIELVAQYAAEVVDRFEVAVRNDYRREASVLALGMVAAATKLSRLIWPYGNRATDGFGVDAAGRIRSRLGWDLLEPIAPACLIPFQAVFRMDAEEVRRAVDMERGVIRLPSGEAELNPLMNTIRAVHHLLATLAAEQPDTMRWDGAHP